MLSQPPHQLIENEEALRARISLPIPLIAGKKFERLFDHDRSLIALSPLLCLTTRGPDGNIDVSIHGGKHGFVQVVNEKTLLVPLFADRRLRNPQDDIPAHSEVGLIFMIPAVTETLRINGWGTIIDKSELVDTFFPEEEQPDAVLQVEIAENYFQCPKALLRSRLWKPDAQVAPSSLVHLRETPEPLTAFDDDCLSFLEHACFTFLGTCNGKEEADISPRGDPPGAFKLLNRKVLLIGDRPGNRLVDSHRNVLQYPQVGLVFLIPGISLVLTVQGRVCLTTDNDILELLAIQGKKPVLGVWIDVETVFLSHSQALERSRVWDTQTHIDPDTLPSLAEKVTSWLKATGKENLPIPPVEVLQAMLSEEALKKELY
jgi:predicted pyridoxine 5'-phosphate oxidase superfamily flavin-nucleotide-binding protein